MDEIRRGEIIEMALSDDVPFEAIEHRFGMKEPDVKRLMRASLKRGSYVAWRKRVAAFRERHVKYKTR